MTRDPLFTWSLRILLFLAAVVVVLSYVGTVQLQGEVERQQRLFECQEAYSIAFQESVSARDTAAQIERQAQRDLLRAVAGPDDQESPGAIGAYISELERSEEIRQANPLPSPGFCRLE